MAKTKFKGLRNWLARRFGIKVYEYQIQYLDISSDPDYRRTGKTTIHIKAAVNHIDKNPEGLVVYMTNNQMAAKMVRRRIQENYPKYLDKINVMTVHQTQIGMRPSKIIWDLIKE